MKAYWLDKSSVSCSDARMGTAPISLMCYCTFYVCGQISQVRSLGKQLIITVLQIRLRSDAIQRCHTYRRTCSKDNDARFKGGVGATSENVFSSHMTSTAKRPGICPMSDPIKLHRELLGEGVLDALPQQADFLAQQPNTYFRHAMPGRPTI